MREVLQVVKELQNNEGDVCLTCGGQAQSVVTRDIVRTQYRRSAKVGRVGNVAERAKSSAEQRAI